MACVAVTLCYLYPGSGGQGSRGLFQTLQRARAGPELPAELALIGQTFRLVYVRRHGLKSRQTEAGAATASAPPPQFHHIHRLVKEETVRRRGAS